MNRRARQAILVVLIVAEGAVIAATGIENIQPVVSADDQVVVFVDRQGTHRIAGQGIGLKPSGAKACEIIGYRVVATEARIGREPHYAPLVKDDVPDGVTGERRRVARIVLIDFYLVAIVARQTMLATKPDKAFGILPRDMNGIDDFIGFSCAMQQALKTHVFDNTQAG